MMKYYFNSYKNYFLSHEPFVYLFFMIIEEKNNVLCVFL